MATQVKKVKLTIPKTKYQTEDYYLAINGKSWQIQRGVPVEVPEYVALAVARHEQCAITSIDFIDKVSKKDDK